MQKVVVIWMWYVWFPLAQCIASSWKYNITWLEIDKAKVKNINNNISPLEWGSPSHSSFWFTSTTDISILKDADYIIVCVPTPIDDDFHPNLDPVIGTCKSISKHLSKRQKIIIESTINPWVCDDIIIPILERNWLKAWIDFHVGHCPERINPWDPHWNVSNIPRNIWATTKNITTEIADFYRSFIQAEIHEMPDIKHAEATKIIENSFRDINIAFVNELAQSFDVLGLDIVEVINGAGNKPFAFMKHYPSCGVWWHCIPVDPYYLIKEAKEKWFHHELLSLGREINNSMPEYTVNKLRKSLNKKKQFLEWQKIWLLWLSYKKDIADIRESPALVIKSILEEEKVELNIYDPHILNTSTSSSLEDILNSSDILVLWVNHSEFTESITWPLLKKHNIFIIVDGKNCLKKDEIINSWIEYIGIGR